jgi:uncharacterized protein DUF3710
VSLFRRRRAGDKVPAAEDVESDVLDEDADDLTDADEADEDDEPDESDDDEDDVEAADSGPYDVADAPDDDLDRADLGALQVPNVPGVEVRLEVTEQGQVVAVVLVAGRSAVRLTALAAPRTDGIWDEVRADLVVEQRKQGGHPTEVTGEFGPELTDRVKTPNGPLDVRLVGIDGPRWFVLAAFQGAVATNPAAAPELLRALRNLVVDRGEDAMPVRNPLPLKLPPEMVEQDGDESPSDGTDGRQVRGR